MLAHGAIRTPKCKANQPFTPPWGAAAGLPRSWNGVRATVTRPGCLERDERIAALERRVAELEAHVGTNATNSGTPPLANPTGAPKPITKSWASRSRCSWAATAGVPTPSCRRGAARFAGRTAARPCAEAIGSLQGEWNPGESG